MKSRLTASGGDLCRPSVDDLRTQAGSSQASLGICASKSLYFNMSGSRLKLQASALSPEPCERRRVQKQMQLHRLVRGVTPPAGFGTSSLRLVCS